MCGKRVELEAVMRFTWSKEPRQTGLAGVCQGPRGFVLKHGCAEVATVSPLTDGPSRWTPNGWYWCAENMAGVRHNSLWNTPRYATPDEAKTACLAYAKTKE